MSRSNRTTPAAYQPRWRYPACAEPFPSGNGSLLRLVHYPLVLLRFSSLQTRYPVPAGVVKVTGLARGRDKNCLTIGNPIHAIVKGEEQATFAQKTCFSG